MTTWHDMTAGKRLAHTWADRWSRMESEAVAIYTALLRRPRPGAANEDLRRLCDDHRQALDLLGAISPSGPVAPPDPSNVPASSPWACALACEADLARLLVELHEAECACLAAYDYALWDPSLLESDRVILLLVLLPRQRSHPVLVERMQGGNRQDSAEDAWSLER
jgi:hypothetical protein